MKRLINLMALLTVALACQATPSIPTVGATLPTGDKNDGAPGTVFHLCKRTYKATRINDNGTLTNFEGYNYLEVYQGPGYCEFSYNGLMGGIEPVWATPYIPYDWLDTSLLSLGKQVGKLPDGTPIGIYPVELIQNVDGSYSFKILREGGTFHHPEIGVSIYNHVMGETEAPDPDYPYPFYMKLSDGYAFFAEMGNGDLVPFDNCMYYDTLIEPTGDYTYAPASDAHYSICQIISRSLSSMCDNRYFPTQGRFVTVATQADSIYVRNLFPESGTMWLKGKLQGGKAIFHRGDVVAMRSELKRLGVYDWKIDDSQWTRMLVLSPVDDVLSFDYDPVAKTLSNPSAAFDGVADSDVEISYLLYKTVNSKPTVFIEAEISPWEDKPLTPQSPMILYKLDYINMFDEGPHSKFTLSDISEEGMLMDSERLYYHLTVNDNIPVEVTLTDKNGDEHVTADIPFNYSGSLNERETCIIQNGYTWYVYYDFDDIEQIDIQLFYKGGGEERSSEISTGIDEIVEPSPASGSTAIYDLQGLQVDPDRLAPGIYIKNGRKFIKH